MVAREVVLARTAVALLAALALLAAAALAQPAVYSLDQQPSWYSLTAPGALRVWPRLVVDSMDTAPWSFENALPPATTSSLTYGGITPSYGYATSPVRSGRYSYYFYIYSASDVSNVYWDWKLTGPSGGGSGYVWLYIVIRVPSADNGAVYLRVFVNDVQVWCASLRPSTRNVTLDTWIQVPLPKPVSGSASFRLRLEVPSFSAYQYYYVYVDDLAFFDYAPLNPTLVSYNATHTVYTITNALAGTVTASLVGVNATHVVIQTTFSGVTTTAYYRALWSSAPWASSPLQPHAATVYSSAAQNAVVARIALSAAEAKIPAQDSYSISVTGLNATVRLPSGLAVHASSHPAWFDAVAVNANQAAVSITAVRSWYALDAPAAVNITHIYPDGSSARAPAALSSGYVVDTTMPAWINFSAASAWLKVVAPLPGENLRIAAPASGAIPVTFYINDYGQGYTHLVVYTPASRIAWRDEISSATKSAVAYLQPYGSYILALRKPGEERVLGPLTVSQTQYTLTVLPQLQPAPPPSTAVVWYNSSLPGYVVDVSCASPPCTITLVKKQATQPQLLTAEFTVPSGGATIAPHLFVWSFDGVDDYVVVEALAPPASSSLSLVTRALLLNPVTSLNQYFISKYERMALRGYMGGLANLGAIWRYSDGTGGELNTGRDIRGAWHHLAVVYANSTGTISIFLDGTEVGRRAASMPLKEGGYYYIGAWHATYGWIPAYISEAIVFSRAVSGSELQAMMNYVVNATGLLFFLDPTWFNGTHYVSLTGGYVGKGYNGVARLPANKTWIWVVQGFPGDGKLHFRFFPEGSRATVWCGSTIIGVQLGWGDVAVQVPAGESCRVTVHVAPQPYVLETASYTCSEARCRFTWITDDPFLEARVEDAAGTTYVVFSGTSLPLQPGGLPGLADLINWLAGRTGLDYLVGPGAVQAFLVALGSILLLIAFSTAGSWEFGLLAAAAGLVLLPILLGAPPLTVPAGLVIALAALSLMLRKEREE
ncbi:MAG: LamG-like jellyroll fold domain-containing protein [Sulfolobales archaeon]